MMPDSAPFAHIAAAIDSDGYIAVQDFLGSEAIDALAAECRILHAQSGLQASAVGRGGQRRRDPALRGDRTCWLDAAAASAAQEVYFAAMRALQQYLNRALLVGLRDFEAHYALYPIGARYARHRDRFRDDDARVLSTVLYLNRDWSESDGGALRLYLGATGDDSHRDVYPAAGTLLLFLSAEFEHEVLPARRERLGIAGWFRRGGAMP